MGGLGMRELVILFELLIVFFLFAWPYSRIFSRVGFSPWLCLLMIVPVVNVIAIWIFAYSNWPALPKPKVAA